MVVKISEINEKDIDTLRCLFLKTRLTTFSWTDTSNFKLADFDAQTKGEYILVARAYEKVIGFVSVWVADNFIHHLYIDEEFHNQHVGTKLLKSIYDKFGLPIRLKCEENNLKATLITGKWLDTGTHDSMLEASNFIYNKVKNGN